MKSAVGYVNGRLSFLGVNQAHDLNDLLRFHEPPFYVYSLSRIRERAEFLKSCFGRQTRVHYAMKANGHPEILRALAALGLGVDVVSGGEMARSLTCGFSPEKIVFSGVGKTRAEIEEALRLGIFQINVESLPELERVAQLAQQLGRKARVALRLNPDVDVATHPYIQTGFRENKFGLDLASIPDVKQILARFSDQIELQGLTLHIGSQIRSSAPYLEAVEKTLSVFMTLRGEGFHLKTLDVGGGFGIDYEQGDEASEENWMTELSRMLLSRIQNDPVQLLIEPGRFLVAHAGVLISQVEYVKRTPFKKFLIVNTGMHHLLRPALYQARHRILPLHEFTERDRELFDVVGPICESADVLGHDRWMPSLQEGDTVAVLDVGAYGAVMASNYNLREPATEIVLNEIATAMPIPQQDDKPRPQNGGTGRHRTEQG